MAPNKTTQETPLKEKADVLVAIGAAMAANCIPCFEHLYEMAVTSGITTEEIKRAAEIGGRVKKGANTALTNFIEELVGSQEVLASNCGQSSTGACCC